MWCKKKKKMAVGEEGGAIMECPVCKKANS
jgi:hypothetical protein